MPRTVKNSAFGGQTGIFGDFITGQRQDQVLESFQFNIPSKRINTTSANGGTITQANSMIVLTSTTATNGAASASSIDTVRYRPGHTAGAFFTCLWTQPNATDTATQYMGMMTTANGFFVGFKNGVFVCGYRNGGTDVTIPITEFNVDHLDDIDFTKLNIFYIKFGWLGTASVEFGIVDKGLYPFHIIHFENTLSTPSIATPIMPIRMEITKTAGSTSLIMKSGSWNGWVVAGTAEDPADRYFSYAASKTAVSTESVIFHLYNQATWQSITNSSEVKIVVFLAAVEGTKPARIRIYKNLTITSPSWSNIDANNSVMQYDTVGTVTPAVANLEISDSLAKSDSSKLSENELSLVLHPGDTITVTAASSTNTDVDISIRWKERF